MNRPPFYPPFVFTRHYCQRCAQRQIPMDCADVLGRYGRAYAGHQPGEFVLWMSPLDALNTRRFDLWGYAEIAVVIADGDRAITAFHLTEAQAQRRWPKGAL